MDAASCSQCVDSNSASDEAFRALVEDAEGGDRRI
jgi:hypothetical protein